MKELSLNILDIAQNSVKAEATFIEILIAEEGPKMELTIRDNGYGMKEASGIKREWYEQADAFDTFVRGKTAAQLTDTKLDGDGKTDAIAGCTISVSGMVESVAKAAED